MIDLPTLRALALAATPGNRWNLKPCDCGYPKCDQFFLSVTRSDGRLDSDDAKYMQAVNPQTVLSLCAELEAARECIEEMRYHMFGGSNDAGLSVMQLMHAYDRITTPTTEGK